MNIHRRGHNFHHGKCTQCGCPEWSIVATRWCSAAVKKICNTPATTGRGG